MAFAGGAEASTSTSTLAPAPSEVDLLYFYPSYYFDIPRLKSRSLKHVRRALKRTLGLSQSMLPSGSTSHRQIHADKTSRPFSAASHSSAVLSNMSRIDETPSVPPSTFDALPYRKSRKQLAYEDRSTETRSKLSSQQAYQSQSSSQPLDSTSEPHQESYAPETRQASLRVTNPSTLTFDELVARVNAKLSAEAPLEETRCRLYELFHVTDRHLIPQGEHVGAADLRHLVEDVCRRHLSINDIAHIEEVVSNFESLSRRHKHLQLNVKMYNTLLVAYCRALRVQDAYRLLEKLRASTVRPNGATYLALVTMHAHLKDPENAQKLLEAMDRENIPIQQKIYTSLMNAHVEAGFWDEAIRIFDFLDSHGDGDSLKPDIHTCTTLLKCYVLMSAPLDDVMHIFNLIQTRGLQPSKKTYALVLQAACDAGAIDFAEEIFARLDEEAGKPNITVFTFTIMMRGMLRAGKQEVANEYYQEMRRRGIEPTSATWSVLMQAYTKAGKPQDNALLTDLLKQYVDTHVDPENGRLRPTLYSEDRSVARGTAMENVYGPVITALGRTPGFCNSKDGTDQQEANINSAQAALTMFSELLNHPGTKPSLHLYTALLDAYRRVDDVEGVQTLWSHIVTYARDVVASATSTATVGEEATGSLVPSSRRNLLCLPLSIYIDAMSSHHRHQEVAQAWQELQSLGFGFDVGNWNHLVAAFVRAGEIDRALWIAEDLLTSGSRAEDAPELETETDNHPQLRDFSASDGAAGASELSSRRKSVIETEKVETPMRPPNRTWQYHQHRKQELLDGQIPIPSLEPRTEPAKLADHDQQISSHHGQPFASSTSIPRRDAHEMTMGYSSLRQEHYAQSWTLFSSTIRSLEEAMRREAREASDQTEGEQKVVSESSLSELQLRRREEYPLTMAAIDAFRSKMRIKS